MAFPKNKSRKITVDGNDYTWVCSYKRMSEPDKATAEKINKAEEKLISQNPSLKKKNNWHIDIDDQGKWEHWTVSCLYVFSEEESQKIQIDFNSKAFFTPSSRGKKVYLDFISITPKTVARVIEYLDLNNLWKNGLHIVNGSELFKLELAKTILEGRTENITKPLADNLKAYLSNPDAHGSPKPKFAP